MSNYPWSEDNYTYRSNPNFFYEVWCVHYEDFEHEDGAMGSRRVDEYKLDGMGSDNYSLAEQQRLDQCMSARNSTFPDMEYLTEKRKYELREKRKGD